MAYQVEIASAASRDLKRISPSITGRIQSHISALADDPRPTGARKVIGREHSYRISVGNFRVIYEVFDDKRLVVIARVIRRSENTYRRLR